MYLYISYEVREKNSGLLHCADSTHVSLTLTQKQDSRSNYCGVFTIVATIANANSYNPLLLHFKEKEMQKHHCDCFENGSYHNNFSMLCYVIHTMLTTDDDSYVLHILFSDFKTILCNCNNRIIMWLCVLCNSV